MLRPYRSSTTYRNLKARGEGVFHVTDDVLLLAQAAIGVPIAPEPELRAGPGRLRLDPRRGLPLLRVPGRSSRRPGRADEDRRSRPSPTGRLRDFLGFNRAEHAVVEAAILATRTAFLPRAEILAEFEQLAVLVAKTGGAAEDAAFRLLREHVLNRSRGELRTPTTARP